MPATARRGRATASILYDPTDFTWEDDSLDGWTGRMPARRFPLNIYEVHLGSWKRHDDGDFLNYRELAAEIWALIWSTWVIRLSN